MTRSFIHLRRALLGASCTVVFGFGATQASARPQQSSGAFCDPYNEWDQSLCNYECMMGPHASLGHCSIYTNECVCDFEAPIDP